MSTTNAYPQVTFDPDGTPRIDDTRYKVIHLAAEHYHHGWTAEELMRQHPDLRPEQVESALKQTSPPARKRSENLTARGPAMAYPRTSRIPPA